MKSFLILFLSITSGCFLHAQNGGDPFELPGYTIRENNIKSIQELDDEGKIAQRAVYDRYGNQTYHKEEERVIEFELDYHPDGSLKKEEATGFRYSVLMNRRYTVNKSNKVDSIIYDLLVGPYYSGFIEKYHYDSKERIDYVDVFGVPEGYLEFRCKYAYDAQNKLKTIHTMGVSEEDTTIYFSKEFIYDSEGKLIRTEEKTPKNDIITIRSFDEEGNVTNETISMQYNTPHEYLYDPVVYAEVLMNLNTPLTTFIVLRNLRKEPDGRPLLQVSHTYEAGNLVQKTKFMEHENEPFVIAVDSFTFNDRNELIHQQTKETYQGTLTTREYAYQNGEQYIYLSSNNASHLVVKRADTLEGTQENITIESYSQRWKCKTITVFDSLARTVTKEQYCLDEEGNYPEIPESTTVAEFDANDSMTKESTFFASTKASIEETYSYENNALVQYGLNGQNWKYSYNPDDSLLIKQEYYSDSVYANLHSYYSYTYDEKGNYTVALIYLKEKDINSYLPYVQRFDAAGKVLQQEWAQRDENFAQIVKYTYNTLGLCTNISRDGMGEVTNRRFVYEYFE